MLAKPAQTLVQTVRGFINQAGFDVVRTVPCSMLPCLGSLPALMKVLFPALAVDCVIDVGANDGQFGAFIRRLGYAGLIVSFEPAIIPFRNLERRARKDGNWLACQLAAGSKEAEAEMHISKSSELNSFKSVNDLGREILGDGAESASVERVRVVRLDEFLPNAIGPFQAERLLLKLDTQGWDLEAAEGAEGLMDDVVAVQTEVAFHALYDGSPSFKESFEYFLERGFDLLTVSPVSVDFQRLVAIESDCLFVRPIPIEARRVPV